MAPTASVQHEFPSFWSERYRQGFDAVAAAWVNPRLPETRLVRLGPVAAPMLYVRNVLLDWKRVLTGRRDLQLTRAQTLLSLPLFAFLRLIDLAGMMKALTQRPRGHVS